MFTIKPRYLIFAIVALALVAMGFEIWRHEQQLRKAATPSESSGPALWKVSDDVSEIWIFGSLHSLSSRKTWRKQAIDDALSAAEEIWLEAPSNLSADADALIAQHGFFPPSKSLAPLLDRRDQGRLKSACILVRVPCETVERMRPWLAALTLGQANIEQILGEVAEPMDSVLEQEARQAGKPIYYFESVADQLDLYIQLPESEQIELLKLAFDDIDIGPPQLNELDRAWLSGDVESFDHLSTRALKNAAPSLYDALYRVRNVTWAQRIREHVRGPQTIMIIVGSGHMSGDTGLPELFRQWGFQVERY